MKLDYNVVRSLEKLAVKSVTEPEADSRRTSRWQDAMTMVAWAQ